jgi:hypothetical protein
MRKPRKKTAFVPSVVFGTVVLGVVPACALSCGGSTATGSTDASSDAPAGDVLNGVAADAFPGVAAVGFCAFCDANSGADAGDASDAPADVQPDVFLGVAAVGFCGFCDAGEAGDGQEGG